MANFQEEVFTNKYVKISKKGEKPYLMVVGSVWNGINLVIPQKEDDSAKAKKTRELLGSGFFIHQGLSDFDFAFKEGSGREFLIQVGVTPTGEVDQYGPVSKISFKKDQTSLLEEDLKARAVADLIKMSSAAPKKVSNFSLSDFLDEEEGGDEPNNNGLKIDQIPEPKKATA